MNSHTRARQTVDFFHSFLSHRKFTSSASGHTLAINNAGCSRSNIFSRIPNRPLGAQTSGKWAETGTGRRKHRASCKLSPDSGRCRRAHLSPVGQFVVAALGAESAQLKRKKRENCAAQVQVSAGRFVAGSSSSQFAASVRSGGASGMAPTESDCLSGGQQNP